MNPTIMLRKLQVGDSLRFPIPEGIHHQNLRWRLMARMKDGWNRRYHWRMRLVKPDLAYQVTKLGIRAIGEPPRKPE